MGNITSRKVYIAVAGVALAGFVLDRTLLSDAGAGPSAAAAATEAESPTPATPAGASVPSAASEVAARLRAAAEGLGAEALTPRDAFALPSVFAVRTPKKDAEPAPAAIPDAAKAFLDAHTLNAVLLSSKGAVVVVNQKRMALNETIDGFTLTEAGPRSATFVSDGTTLTLDLPRR